MEKPGRYHLTRWLKLITSDRTKRCHMPLDTSTEKNTTSLWQSSQNTWPVSNHRKIKVTKLRDILQKGTGLYSLTCQGHQRQSKIKKLFQIKGDLRDMTTKYNVWHWIRSWAGKKCFSFAIKDTGGTVGKMWINTSQHYIKVNPLILKTVQWFWVCFFFKEIHIEVQRGKGTLYL